MNYSDFSRALEKFRKTQEPPLSKVCARCGEEKSSSEFTRTLHYEDGLHCYCKKCYAARRAIREEARRAKARTRHAANPEKRRETCAAWTKANPEKNAANSRNYLARKRNAPGSHTAEDVQSQYERQKGKCHWCDCKVGDDYHVDHVVPLSKGGSNWPSNLVIACPTCNHRKHAKHPMEFAGQLL